NAAGAAAAEELSRGVSRSHRAAARDESCGPRFLHRPDRGRPGSASLLFQRRSAAHHGRVSRSRRGFRSLCAVGGGGGWIPCFGTRRARVPAAREEGRPARSGYHQLNCVANMTTASLANFVLLVLLTTAAFAEDWPAFRGARGDGVAREDKAPWQWGPEKNV